jgi:hypothetical protein
MEPTGEAEPTPSTYNWEIVDSVSSPQADETSTSTEPIIDSSIDTSTSTATTTEQ